MKFACSLLIFLLAHALFSQDIQYPYTHDLKGPVQSCSEKRYAVTFSGGKIGRGDYKPDDKTGVRLFDRQGRLVEFRTPADTATGKYKRIVITYNATTCWQKMEEYREDGGFHSRSEYRCDGHGNVVEQVDYYYIYGDRPTSITTYKHDDAGHVRESHERYGNPKVGPKNSPPEFVKDQYLHRYYEYDKNEFLVKWSMKREGIDPEFGSLMSGSAELTNDAQGRPIAEYSLNDLAAQDGKTKKLAKEMMYNAEGFLAQHVTYTKYGGPKVIYYDYTYDAHGNWNTRTELHATATPGKANATPDNIVVREISYYQN